MKKNSSKTGNKALAAVLALLLVLILPLPCGAAAAAGPKTGAQAAVLMEAGTHKVLWSQNAHERLPMASTTKIMTALVAIENGKLNELVTVEPEAFGVEGSSVYLQLGEKLSLQDLLYGLMLRSGNDAAVAIALHIGGSVEGFAKLMNDKAKSIGALNTHFVTPNGLQDPEHYTTAYDLALISAEALKSEAFRRLVTATYYRTQSGSVQRTWKNKNRLLWEYEGCTGLKTGYTKAAGKCLAASALREGMELVSVVINCPDMFNDTKAMLDWGFSNFEMRRVLSAGDVVARARMFSADKNVLELAADKDIIVPVPAGGAVELETAVELLPADLPVAEGELLGSVKLYENGVLLGSAGLKALQSAQGLDYGYYINRLFRDWSA